MLFKHGRSLGGAASIALFLSISCVALAPGRAAAQTAPQPFVTHVQPAKPVTQQPVSAEPDLIAETIARTATLGGDDNRTQFVAGLSKAVKVNIFTLADPYRVVVELPEVKFQLPQGLGKNGHGLVKSYRYGLFMAGKSRIVLETTGPVLVEKSNVIEGAQNAPAHLVIDLVPTDRTTFMAGQSRQLIAVAQPNTAAKLGGPKARQSAEKQVKKPVIVIDPGHGGHDSGANKNGVVEKDVVLAFGKALRDKLLATGRYEVLMTRENDKFVELDERREFARRHGAALFLAIHADYVPSGNHVRGATIYSLRSSVANSMSRGLHRNNSGDLLAGVELEAIKNTDTDTNTLKSILADLAEREAKPTKDKTNFFAKNVIEYMGQTTEMKPDPHREAAFRVLKSAEVPSVLIELAYVSNRQDAENLKSVEWREKVSNSIANAVARYFNFTGLPL